MYRPLRPRVYYHILSITNYVRIHLHQSLCNTVWTILLHSFLLAAFSFRSFNFRVHKSSCTPFIRTSLDLPFFFCPIGYLRSTRFVILLPSNLSTYSIHLTLCAFFSSILPLASGFQHVLAVVNLIAFVLSLWSHISTSSLLSGFHSFCYNLLFWPVFSVLHAIFFSSIVTPR